MVFVPVALSKHCTSDSRLLVARAIDARQLWEIIYLDSGQLGIKLTLPCGMLLFPGCKQHN